MVGILEEVIVGIMVGIMVGILEEVIVGILEGIYNVDIQ